MTRLLSAFLSLVFVSNLAVPAIATAEEAQRLAISRMDRGQKSRFAAMADRLEARVARMSPERQDRFYSKLLKLVERAELRVEKMSEQRLVKKLARLEKAGASVVAETHEDLEASAETRADAVEVAEVMNSAAESVDVTTVTENDEVLNDRLNDAMSALQGSTAKERILNITHALKQELSQKVASHPAKLDRKVAASIDLFVALIIFTPLVVGIVIGLVIGAILVPMLVGLAATVFIITRIGLSTVI